MCLVLQQWEHGGYHECRGKRGDKGEGGHRADVAAQLARNHRGSGGGGTDDAGEHSFPQNLLLNVVANKENNPYIGHNEHYLCHKYPQMPAVGAHLVEVNLAESDQQREEHKEREDDVEHWSEPVAGSI